jgi:hypothetical protein
MKIQHLIFLALPLLFTLSCNTDEGLGGSSSIEGYVYNVVYNDDNFSFHADTFPAAGKKVYIKYGSEAYVSDDVDANEEGLYRFDYLREGSYTVYALSELRNGQKTAEMQTVSVKSHAVAPPIYICSGDAYGTASIVGYVYALFYHNGAYRDAGAGIGVRAYIRKVGDASFDFDDVRASQVSEIGGKPVAAFIFQKLLPGEYIVSVETITPDTEKPSLIDSDTVKIEETEKIYTIPTVFNVNVGV